MIKLGECGCGVLSLARREASKQAGTHEKSRHHHLEKRQALAVTSEHMKNYVRTLFLVLSFFCCCFFRDSISISRLVKRKLL